MNSNHGPYAMMAELLDSLNVGVCIFDDDDCALLWNRTFLRLFPEHDGPIAPGEHYSVNLRRFYLARLGPDELPHIDRYIAEHPERLPLLAQMAENANLATNTAVNAAIEACARIP